MEKVPVEEGDLVVAMSDGVVDNLWEHEVVDNGLGSLRTWKGRGEEVGSGMVFVAEELVKAARVIAEDPFAESPFMERAVEEGLAMEGGEVFFFKLFGCLVMVVLTMDTLGKLDDISVVAALCRRRKG